MKPTYIRIKEHLEQLMDARELQPGAKLSSEVKMAKKFNVSRETFRAAVRILESEGKLIVKQGAGTFVVTPLPNISNRLEKLGSVTDMIQSAGLEEGERQEYIRQTTCTKEWADILKLKEGDSIIVNERVRTADGEPVVVSVNILPQEVAGKEILELAEIGSLFNYLEKERNVHITSADAELNVPLHTDVYCQRLLIRPETTVLLMKQLHYNELNKPVLYSLDYFRNDIFTFTVRRERE